MHVRWTPGVVVVFPGVWRRLDSGELVCSVITGDCAAHTREVWIDRSRMLVAFVNVPARSVGLPHLNELVAYRAAMTIEYASTNDDALADWFAIVLNG